MPVTNKEKAKVLDVLVEDGHVSAEIVNIYIQKLREGTSEEIDSVLKKEERKLSLEQKERLLKILEARFMAHMQRHEGIKWENVRVRLDEADPQKLFALNKMEETGGEPDVIGVENKDGSYDFYDCSRETPESRRDIAYDRASEEEARRRNKEPKGNAVDMAEAIGITILTPDEYRKLQKTGRYDLETFSLLKTDTLTRDDYRAFAGYLVGDDGRGPDEIVIKPISSYACFHMRGFRGKVTI